MKPIGIQLGQSFPAFSIPGRIRSGGGALRGDRSWLMREGHALNRLDG